MKLPEIQLRRETPALESAKAAALPNQLRAITAQTQAAQQVISATDQAIENESRLNAASRAQKARQEYLRRRSELDTAYTNDASLSLENYARDLEEMRTSVRNDATDNASVRTQTYLNSALDAFDTQAVQNEIASVQRLTEERAVMHVADMTQTATRDVMSNPSAWEETLEELSLAANSDALPARTKQELSVTIPDTIARTAADAMLQNNQVPQLLDMVESDAFKDLPADTQSAIVPAALEAATVALDQATDRLANQALTDAISIEDAQASVADLTSVYTLDDANREQTARAVEDKLVTSYIKGLIARNDLVLAREELESGKFDDVLAPATKASLYAATIPDPTQLPADTQLRGKLRFEIERIVDAAEAGGPPLPPAEIESALAMIGEYKRTWTDIGKPVGEAATDRLLRYAETLQKHLARANMTYNLEFTATDTIISAADDIPTRDEKAIKREAMQDRAEIAASEATALMAGAGFDIKPMPRTDDGAVLFNWMSERAGQFREFTKALESYDVSGPLSPDEVTAFNQMLRTMQGQNVPGPDGELVNAFTQFLGGLPDAMDDWPTLNALFTQLSEDDDAGVLPIAAQLSALGYTEVADEVLRGNALIANREIDVDATKVDQDIADAIGNAFYDMDMMLGNGESSQLYTIYKDAIMGVYAARMAATGQGREDVVSETILNAAIEAVTGGVITLGDADFIMPNADVQPAFFEQWMERQDSTTLPTMYDGVGKAVPAQQIDAYWMNRFMPEPSPSPNVYYVRDTKGSSGVGRGQGTVPGSLMRNKDGNLYTFEFDANNFVKRNYTSVRDLRNR